MKERIDTLREIKSILDKQNILYWIDSGTLLGIIRDKKLLSWDHDIDLGMWIEEYKKIRPLFDVFRKKGYQVIEKDFKKNKYGKEIFLIKERYYVNLFFYYPVGIKAIHKWCIPKQGIITQFLDYIYRLLVPKYYNKSKVPESLTMLFKKLVDKLPDFIKDKLIRMIHYLFEIIGNEAKLEVPIKFFNNLSSITFYGMKFNFPSPVEEYLEYRYGKDWKIPKREWRYYIDDRAIKIIK